MIDGDLFEKRSSKRSRVQLKVTDQECFIYCDGSLVDSKMDIEQIQDKIIMFSCGRQFIADNTFDLITLKNLNSRTKKPSAIFFAISLRKKIILSLAFLFLLISVRYIFLSESPFLVKLIPVALEQKIGENTYNSLIKNPLYDFQESNLSTQKKTDIINHLNTIAYAANIDKTIEAKFHSAESIGPNAFAFPGGPILITDELVMTLNENEIIAILAHEIAHVKKRHSLQQLIKLAGLTTISTLLFDGIFGSDLLADSGVIALFLKSSRDLEKDADMSALKYLDAANVDRKNLLFAMERILACPQKEGSKESCDQNNYLSWLSTHPSPKNRLEYLRVATQ